MYIYIYICIYMYVYIIHNTCQGGPVARRMLEMQVQLYNKQ